jgi:RNA polymerase sigma-70 factor (ECF subfamily)
VSAPERSEIALSALAARAQLGDRASLEALLRRLADHLRPHVQQLTRDDDWAEDVLQEVLLRVARKLPDLREHAWVRAWAYRIATREIVRQVSRKRRVSLASLEAAADVPAPEPADESAFDPGLIARLPAAVSALPEATRMVVRLRYLHGLSQTEVAEALSIPLGTVKSRLAYGLRRLRAQVGGSGSGEPPGGGGK